MHEPILFIFLLVGVCVICLGCLISYLWNGRRKCLINRKFSARFLTFSLLCTALTAFAGCSSGSGGAAQQSTPASTTGVAPGATSSTSITTQKWDDWFTYHHDTVRSGYLADTPDPRNMSLAWNEDLDGAVYGQPLMVKGHVVVATEGDTLYSLDPQTGKVLWRTNVGSPVSRSTLSCGDIDPLGITGTPVYDPTTNLVFAVAEIAGPQHILVGVDANSGQVRVRRSMDLPGMETDVYQQRSALALFKDTVYVTYGGLAGDCGNYRGTIIASKTDGKGSLLSYVVPTPRMGGIWATSGPAIDSNGTIFVSVGNGEETSGNWDHSDSVLRISPQLKLEDAFAPRDWQVENSSDTDLGSIGPMLLPNGLVFIAGKSGKGYILHANALGGVGGQVSETQICNGLAMGGGAWVGSSILVPCTDGVRRVTVDSSGKITIDWHDANMVLPPTIGGHTVYGLDSSGTLDATDLDSGNVRAQVNVTEVPHFATPTLSGRSVFVGTMKGVAAVTLA